jgi:hypothetical protein
MNRRLLWAVIPAAVLAIGLAACGGGSSKSSSGETASTETSDSGSSGSSGGGLTAPGTDLGLGEEAIVNWASLSKEEAGEKGSAVKASVTAIEKRSIGDLSGLELEPEEEEKTPYYVKVKLEALTDTEAVADDDPAFGFLGVDDRGQDQFALGIIGSFPDCEKKSAPKPWSAGESYESCFVYLVHDEGSIAEVQWNSPIGSPYEDEPVAWTAE